MESQQHGRSRRPLACAGWRAAACLAGALTAGCPAATSTSPAPRPDAEATAQPPDGGGSATAAGAAVDWPELPRTKAAATSLIRRRIQRPESDIPDSELDADAILRHAAATGWGTMVAGEDGTRRWIQSFLDRAAEGGSDAYVVFGIFHDSPGQVDAFRRLVGPGGLRDLTAVGAEQFRATGAWRGVDAAAQKGDDPEIAAFVERGDVRAFDALARHHRDGDYVAWKLGYEPTVLDLLVTARAALGEAGKGPRFVGCNMPKETQRLLGDIPEDDQLRLREIHCLTSLDEVPSTAGPRRVALLWGQAHAQAFRRFFPSRAEVLSLYVFGFRAGEGTTEAKLRPHVALADPVLIPLGERGDVAALLYPDAVLGASVERVREPGAGGDGGGEAAAPPHVVFRVPASGRLVVGDRTIDLASGGACPAGTASCVAKATVDVTPGDHAYSLEVGPLRLAGALRVPEGGELELDLDPSQRAVRWTERDAPAK